MLLWKGGVHFLFSCSIATHSCLVLFIRHYLVFMSSFYCIIHVNAWKWIKCSVDIVKCNVNVYQGVPQSVQLKGFPLYESSCAASEYFFLLKLLSQTVQLNVFSPLWKFITYGDLIVQSMLMVLGEEGGSCEN